MTTNDEDPRNIKDIRCHFMIMFTGDVLWFLFNTITVRFMGMIVYIDIVLAISDCMFKSPDGIAVCPSKYNHNA